MFGKDMGMVMGPFSCDATAWCHHLTPKQGLSWQVMDPGSKFHPEHPPSPSHCQGLMACPGCAKNLHGLGLPTKIHQKSV